MKMRKIAYLSLMLLSTSHYVNAGEINPDLNNAREQVIRRYILDLESGNAQDIGSLFGEGGTVISTSRGNINAKDFFNSFLPNIESATTEFHQAFISNVDSNRYAARFHFNFKLKDGESGDGEYVDEFIFANNSDKLSNVYMFENLKFNIQN